MQEPSPLHRRRRIQGSSRPPLSRDPLLYGVVLIGLAACAPFFRYVSSLGDEGVLLHGAVRILGGEALYRDFFGILPPGGYLIVTGWMKLFGVGFACVRALAVGVIVGIAALIYAAARLSSGSRPLAALVAITWAVLSQGALTVINHHWFTTAASMASAVGLLLVVDGAPRRGAAFVAGLFAGIAAMVSSTRGPRPTAERDGGNGPLSDGDDPLRRRQRRSSGGFRRCHPVSGSSLRRHPGRPLRHGSLPAAPGPGRALSGRVRPRRGRPCAQPRRAVARSAVPCVARACNRGPTRELPAPRLRSPLVHRAARLPALRAYRTRHSRSRPDRGGCSLKRLVPRGSGRRDCDCSPREQLTGGRNSTGPYRAGSRSAGPRLRGPHVP